VDLQRFFTLDTDAGSWQVRDEIRDIVEFRHHNLVTELPPYESGQVDLVLCRNVTIYFDRDTTKALMQRLHGCLRDGGYLFLGHAATAGTAAPASGRAEPRDADPVGAGSFDAKPDGAGAHGAAAFDLRAGAGPARRGPGRGRGRTVRRSGRPRGRVRHRPAAA